MKIVIKTKNLKLENSLEDLINEKINSLEKFLGKNEFKAEARFEIEKMTSHHQKGPYYRAECQIQLPGKSIRSESVSEDLNLALYDVKDEMQRELKEYREKLTTKRRKEKN